MKKNPETEKGKETTSVPQVKAEIAVEKTKDYIVEDSILKNYTHIYTAYDFETSDSYNQMLALNWLHQDTIAYYLEYYNQLCEGYYTGNVIINKSQTKHAITNNDSLSLAVLEYLEQKESELVVVIQFLDQNKDSVAAGVFASEYAVECSPYEFIMHKIQ
ncbi:hypothetical protein [Aquimarina brevivitae]|uniref:hypothetical protein n=1 Tax=Aquimarina brevivitae TaxID=323412 RepID=UPI001A912C71|nr:hypothetical protein [Aquimarina brevivitae]